MRKTGRLIGLGGFTGSGKNSFSEVLVNHGWIRAYFRRPGSGVINSLEYVFSRVDEYLLSGRNVVVVDVATISELSGLLERNGEAIWINRSTKGYIPERVYKVYSPFNSSPMVDESYFDRSFQNNRTLKSLERTVPIFLLK